MNRAIGRFMECNVVARAFRDAIAETVRQIREAQLLLVASSLAYTTILSLIPLLAVSFAVFQAFGGMEKLYATIRPLIVENLAEGASDEAIQTINRFIENAHAGTIGISGFVGLVFTSMSMLSSIEKAINRIWRAPISRTLFQRISSYWLFITLGPLALAVVAGVVTGTSNMPVTKLLPSGAGLFLMTVGIFFGIYKWVPHTRVDWRYALISSFITAVFWNLARIAYQFYTAKAVSYNRIYGSLGAVPILLLWIYIIWIIVLGGAALTAGLQKKFEPRIKEAEGR